MAFAIPNRSRVNVAKAYLAPIIFTAASNATECELTVASAAGILAGDVVEVNSGWLKLDNMVVRVKSVSGTKIVLEAFDTTNTAKFPAGTGAGTLRKIDSWITMPQVMTLSTEGGDQQTISIQFWKMIRPVPSQRSKMPWCRSTPSRMTRSWLSTNG